MSGCRSTCELTHEISNNGFYLPLTELIQWYHAFTDSPPASGAGREPGVGRGSQLVRTLTLQTANRSPTSAARRYRRVGAR